MPGAVPEDGHQDLDELPVRLGVQPSGDPGRRRNFLPLAGETTEFMYTINRDEISVPDPPDPRVFGPPGSGSFYLKANIERKTLISTVLCIFLTFYLCK